MNEKRMTDEELTKEAQFWEDPEWDPFWVPEGWVDCPGSSPAYTKKVPNGVTVKRKKDPTRDCPFA